MELNAEQVKKALEYCKSPKLTKCDGCPREHEDGLCMYRLNEDALALINQLTEENANWEVIAEGYRKQFEDCAEERAKLTEENERLKSELRQTTQKLNTVICLNDKLTADNEWIKTRRMPEEGYLNWLLVGAENVFPGEEDKNEEG
jgi:hypothetical protein